MLKKNKPVIIADNVLHLPPADAGLRHSILRVHNSLIGKKGQVGKFYRHQPLLIVNPNTGCRVVRFAMGSHPAHPIQAPTSIMVDYGTKVELDWDPSHIVNVLPANGCNLYRYYWRHPDTGYRISTRLGVLSVMLGALGMMSALIR
ncbi:hypothetical protein [Geoalkalibacter halelectricus]|uniref:hypothetical protein n=1 Tax=Geoalkalibacter halelectricus TaxID=2847045 RepID=UPI003D1CB11C